MKFALNKNSKINGETIRIRNFKDGTFFPYNHTFDTDKVESDEKIRLLRLFRMGDLVECPKNDNNGNKK